MSAVAGWYPHPTDPNAEAYWDGAVWTGQVRPRFAPAAPPPPPPVAAHQPSPSYPPSYTPSTGSPMAPLADIVVSPARPRRRLWAGLGVAAVLTAGAGATFAAMRAASGQGGADTPVAAVEQLMEAADNQDMLGALDVLLPSERETFGDAVPRLFAELERLEILADVDLSGVQGFDIVVEDLTLSSETVAADVANVTMDGRMGVSVAGADLPLGPVFDEYLGDGADSGWRNDLDADMSYTDLDGAQLTTVQADGRWFVSFTYSVAEAARRDAGLPMPEEGLPLSGAETAEAAVDQLFDAVEQLDLAAVLGALHPGEFGAVQRYAPLFLEDAQAALDESGLSWEVVALDYDVVADGDRARVTVNELGIDATVDDGYETVEASLRWDGRCLSLSGEGESYEECVEGDAAEVRFTVLKSDGLWYVAPFTSLFDVMFDAMAVLEPSDVRAFLDGTTDFGGLFEDFLDLGSDVVGDSSLETARVEAESVARNANALAALEAVPTNDEHLRSAASESFDALFDEGDSSVLDDGVATVSAMDGDGFLVSVCVVIEGGQAVVLEYGCPWGGGDGTGGADYFALNEAAEMIAMNANALALLGSRPTTDDDLQAAAAEMNSSEFLVVFTPGLDAIPDDGEVAVRGLDGTDAGVCVRVMNGSAVLLPCAPAGYGSDPELDLLWDACAAGGMQACDDLFIQSPFGSTYEEFGATCGGLREPGFGSCTDLTTFDGSGDGSGSDGPAVGPFTYGDDPELDGMWDACAQGNMGACDELYVASPSGSDYEQFGSTCGLTRPDSFDWCEQT